MKIYFYINVLAGGGAERVIANLSTQFSENGHKVAVITSFSRTGEYKVGKDVVRYNLEKEEKEYKNRISKNFARIFALRKILKKDKPDVLVSFMAEPNFRAIIASLFIKTKVVVSVRSLPDMEYAGSLGAFVRKYIMPMADGCVFQTDYAKKSFSKRLQKKSEIIFNPIKKEFFQHSNKFEYGNIVTCGRLVLCKNYKMLIDAFAEIADIYIEAKLSIYGDGELKTELEKQIKSLNLDERVILKGNVENVENVLTNAHMFISSSDYDGMPNALMEAMAVGVPCIATDCPCGASRMLIDNMKTGILVPVNDKDKMSEAMKLLLDDEKLAMDLGIGAKVKTSEFEPTQVYAQWEQYMCNILNKK